MIVDLEANGASWFDLETGGRVQLKTLSFEDWREIEKATKRKGAPEYPKLGNKYERFQPDVIDEDARLEMIYDKTIVAWEGIFDKNQTPIPCTKECKIKLMTLAPAFRDFYNEKMKVLLGAEAEQGAEAAKNS